MFSYRSRGAPKAADAAIHSLLVVCTGNLCRSPMAAALFAARAQDLRYPLRVASAGIAAFAGHLPPSPVITLIARRGLNISRHKARQLTGVLARRHDMILVMDREQQAFVQRHWSDLADRVFRLGAWRDRDVVDPYGTSENCYADCLACIEACVADWEPQLFKSEPQGARDWPA